MNRGEYRQIPLPGFDDIGVIRQYLLSREASKRSEGEQYTLTPENFLDAIEHGIASVSFRDLQLFYGRVDFIDSDTDHPIKHKARLTIASNASHERQARNLVHEMAHIDRGPTDFGSNPEIKEAGSLTVQEFKELHPGVFEEYLVRTGVIIEEEERIVADAAEEFFILHSTLAKLALCLVWDRS